MLPHWHLQQWHRLWSGVLAEVLSRKTVEHNKVPSLPARGGGWHTQHRSLWRLDLVTSCLSLVSWKHFAVGTKLCSVMLRSLPPMTNATDPRSVKSVAAVRSRESVIASSVFSPNFTSQIAACVFSSSSSLDSHKRRTDPLETILAWTSASAVRITCA